MELQREREEEAVGEEELYLREDDENVILQKVGEDEEEDDDLDDNYEDKVREELSQNYPPTSSPKQKQQQQLVLSHYKQPKHTIKSVKNKKLENFKQKVLQQQQQQQRQLEQHQQKQVQLIHKQKLKTIKEEAEEYDENTAIKEEEEEELKLTKEAIAASAIQEHQPSVYETLIWGDHHTVKEDLRWALKNEKLKGLEQITVHQTIGNSSISSTTSSRLSGTEKISSLLSTDGEYKEIGGIKSKSGVVVGVEDDNVERSNKINEAINATLESSGIIEPMMVLLSNPVLAKQVNRSLLSPTTQLNDNSIFHTRSDLSDIWSLCVETKRHVAASPPVLYSSSDTSSSSAAALPVNALDSSDITPNAYYGYEAIRGRIHLLKIFDTQLPSSINRKNIPLYSRPHVGKALKEQSRRSSIFNKFVKMCSKKLLDYLKQPINVVAVKKEGINHQDDGDDGSDIEQEEFLNNNSMSISLVPYLLNPRPGFDENGAVKPCYAASAGSSNIISSLLLNNKLARTSDSAFKYMFPLGINNIFNVLELNKHCTLLNLVRHGITLDDLFRHTTLYEDLPPLELSNIGNTHIIRVPEELRPVSVLEGILGSNYSPVRNTNDSKVISIMDIILLFKLDSFMMTTATTKRGGSDGGGSNSKGYQADHSLLSLYKYISQQFYKIVRSLDRTITLNAEKKNTTTQIYVNGTGILPNIFVVKRIPIDLSVYVNSSNSSSNSVSASSTSSTTPSTTKQTTEIKATSALKSLEEYFEKLHEKYSVTTNILPARNINDHHSWLSLLAYNPRIHFDYPSRFPIEVLRNAPFFVKWTDICPNSDYYVDNYTCWGERITVEAPNIVTKNKATKKKKNEAQKHQDNVKKGNNSAKIGTVTQHYHTTPMFHINRICGIVHIQNYFIVSTWNGFFSPLELSGLGFSFKDECSASKKVNPLNRESFLVLANKGNWTYREIIQHLSFGMEEIRILDLTQTDLKQTLGWADLKYLTDNNLVTPKEMEVLKKHKYLTSKDMRSLRT